jgi:hypothetical protein
MPLISVKQFEDLSSKEPTSNVIADRSPAHEIPPEFPKVESVNPLANAPVADNYLFVQREPGSGIPANLDFDNDLDGFFEDNIVWSPVMNLVEIGGSDSATVAAASKDVAPAETLNGILDSIGQTATKQETPPVVNSKSTSVQGPSVMLPMQLLNQPSAVLEPHITAKVQEQPNARTLGVKMPSRILQTALDLAQLPTKKPTTKSPWKSVTAPECNTVVELSAIAAKQAKTQEPSREH